MTNTVYSRNHPGKYGLCIDWETTGSNFGGDSTIDYQGIAFGAIIFDTETFEPVDALYKEMHFDDKKYKWTDGAEKIHGLTREHLKTNGVPREEALAELLDLILKYIGTNKILVLGHNADFDIAFTNQLASDFDIELKFHHVNIDTSSLGFVTIGKYRSNDVFSFFYGEREKVHNALDDANMALTVARSIRTIFKEALGQ